MDVYVPILDLPQKRNHTPSTLSHVAVQGNINFDRRDYLGIYADLLVSFKGEQFDVILCEGDQYCCLTSSEDLQACGYLLIAGRNPAHEVDETLKDGVGKACYTHMN